MVSASLGCDLRYSVTYDDGLIVAAYSILDVENDVGSGNFDMIKVSSVLPSCAIRIQQIDKKIRRLIRHVDTYEFHCILEVLDSDF